MIAKSLRPSFLTASRTPFRLIGIAFGGKKLLLLHSESKGAPTIDTGEGLFLKYHA
jgi:hypothetical protein